MKETEGRYLTTILRFHGKKGEEPKWHKYKDCEFIQNLRFMNREFYLVYRDGVYYMTTDKGADVASVYLKKEVDGAEKLFPGEVVSLFRKEYLKHNITSDMVDLFLEDPVKYREKYGKFAV